MSGPAVKRISESPLTEMIVTDTIPLTSEALDSGKLHVVSVADLLAYNDTGEDWAVREGYGTLIARYGAGLPVTLNAPVTEIDWSGPRLRLTGPTGTVSTRAAILTVSTTAKKLTLPTCRSLNVGCCIAFGSSMAISESPTMISISGGFSLICLIFARWTCRLSISIFARIHFIVIERTIWSDGQAEPSLISSITV